MPYTFDLPDPQNGERGRVQVTTGWWRWGFVGTSHAGLTSITDASRAALSWRCTGVFATLDTSRILAHGLNASMWTIGLAKTGNEMGLNEKEVEALPKSENERRIKRAYQRMYQAGAHYVVDSITDVMPCLDDINARLARGERP